MEKPNVYRYMSVCTLNLVNLFNLPTIWITLNDCYKINISAGKQLTTYKIISEMYWVQFTINLYLRFIGRNLQFCPFVERQFTTFTFVCFNSINIGSLSISIMSEVRYTQKVRTKSERMHCCITTLIKVQLSIQLPRRPSFVYRFRIDRSSSKYIMKWLWFDYVLYVIRIRVENKSEMFRSTSV
jgi:hypothetical protein